MIFSNNLFMSYINAFVYGIALGFFLGFIAWAMGYAIYHILKIFKSSSQA